MEIRSENTAEQDLMSEVGKKSADEDLAGNEVIELKTSSGVTAGMVVSGVPTNGWSGGGDCKLGNLDAINDFRLAILATKKVANLSHRRELSRSDLYESAGETCRSSLTVRQR